MIRSLAAMTLALALAACGSQARFEQNNAAITAELANIAEATPDGPYEGQDDVLHAKPMGRDMPRAPATPPHP